MELDATVVIVGGILTLFTFIGVSWKLMRFVFRVDRALPTLLNIAHQFENNGGSTLKDKIDGIAKEQKELHAADKFAVKIAEDSRLIAETNAKIVNELSTNHSDDLRRVEQYIHDSVHDLKNKLVGVDYVNLRLDRVEERLDLMLPLVSRRRSTDEEPNSQQPSQG